ncbi:MAG: hypothetical protein KC656_21955 [Myxococcales bacterium]|nr:hypothetical protein [Myxococcales bacterium]
MGTRETLFERADVRDEDVDDIVALAARLQDEARDAADEPTAEEVQAVARELDIAPEYVDQAIAKVAAQKEAEAASRAREAQEAGERRQLLLRGAGVAGALGALGLLGLLGLAVAADSRMDTARGVRDQAERSLVVVLDRQASLAPQLVGLAGGDGAELASLASDLRGAGDLDARMAASDALGAAMATALGRLPPAADPATTQSRLELQYEVTGTANRITTERRRYEEADAAYAATRQGLGASIALGLGLHP